MKKNKNIYVLIGLFVITTVNLIAVLNIDADFNLRSGDIEALASNEGYPPPSEGGYELQIGFCADGEKEYISCEWGWDYTGRCSLEDEVLCTTENYPLDPEGQTNNPVCVKQGHDLYSTYCFIYCTRCSYVRSTCKD